MSYHAIPLLLANGKALKVASDIRIINRKIHDAKFFMNFASLLGWLGEVVHSVRVFDSAWMLVFSLDLC